MQSTAAARRYAKAMFSLAQEEGRVDAVRRELAALDGLFHEHAEFRDAIFQPLHPGVERRAALTAVCDRLEIAGAVRNFCALLVDQRRVIDFGAIRAEFDQLSDRAAGRTRAQVVSASPLADSQRERLRNALAARTGQQIELDESVDPSLLGGAIASVGGLVFDGSLRTQLQQLRASLTKQA
jgi:F-type H+-transporting ATPase subunit delta